MWFTKIKLGESQPWCQIMRSWKKKIIFENVAATFIIILFILPPSFKREIRVLVANKKPNSFYCWSVSKLTLLSLSHSVVSNIIFRVLFVSFSYSGTYYKLLSTFLILFVTSSLFTKRWHHRIESRVNNNNNNVYIS